MGKSELGRALKRPGVEFVPEVIPHDKLKMFINHMARGTDKYDPGIGELDPLGFQLIMASTRIIAQNKALKEVKRNKLVFLERSIISDYCFARCCIDSREDLIYYENFSKEYLWPRMVQPDLVIYLKGSFQGETARIKERARDGEAWYLTRQGEIYRKQLNLEHDNMLCYYKKYRIMTLNPDDLDWRDPIIADDILDEILIRLKLQDL